jgi:hypothetical protein
MHSTRVWRRFNTYGIYAISVIVSMVMIHSVALLV